jgi:hypothetical protein
MRNGTDIQNLLDEDCIICLEPILSSEFCLLSCNHYYHENCIKEWYKKSTFCPLCSRNIILSNRTIFDKNNNIINTNRCCFYVLCCLEC